MQNPKLTARKCHAFLISTHLSPPVSILNSRMGSGIFKLLNYQLREVIVWKNNVKTNTIFYPYPSLLSFLPFYVPLGRGSLISIDDNTL